jgi:hypothetical protein
VTGRKLYSSLSSVSSLAVPRFRALVDLGLRHGYYLFHKPAEALKGIWVWRFGCLHLLVAFVWLFESNSLIAKDNIIGKHA